jgi:cell division protein FtsL
MYNISIMKPRALTNLLIIICVVLLSAVASIYMQNRRYVQQNRQLLLENDSILSVNQELHQRLDMEASNWNNN